MKEKILRTLINRNTMIACSALGVASIPYWIGYFAGYVQGETIHAVFEIIDHKGD